MASQLPNQYGSKSEVGDWFSSTYQQSTVAALWDKMIPRSGYRAHVPGLYAFGRSADFPFPK